MYMYVCGIKLAPSTDDDSYASVNRAAYYTTFPHFSMKFRYF